MLKSPRCRRLCCFFVFFLVLFEGCSVSPWAFCIFCLIALSLSLLFPLPAPFSGIVFLPPWEMLCEKQSEETNSTVDLTEAPVVLSGSNIYLDCTLSSFSAVISLTFTYSHSSVKCRWCVFVCVCLWTVHMHLWYSTPHCQSNSLASLIKLSSMW